MLNVTLLSTEWKSSKEGFSTINRELAIQLAKHPDVKVSVYLPQCTCSGEDINNAASLNVKIIEAEEQPSFEPVDWLCFVPENHAMDCVIGHGVHLGRQIPLIKKQKPHCKWVQVVHTAPEVLGMYKSYEDAISKGEQKQLEEVKLCELANQVVAVGPKMADAFARYLRPSKKDQDVLTLTPSIFHEFLSVEQATEERRTFCVLVFGRGDSEDFKLKGYDIAVQAVSELKDPSYQLMFVGAPAGKEHEVAERLLQHGIPRSQLTVRRFKERRDQLANLFCEVDLAIMPSRTEGFGLTALEALSAGLPVLVSGNSGLGVALREVAYGSPCVVDSEDPKEWAKKIKAVREKSREVRLAESKLLRNKYLEKFSWQESCGLLLEKMQNLVSALNLKIDVETMKPVEHSTQALRIPASTVESEGSQNVGHQEASAVPVSSGQTQPSCTGAETTQAPMSSKIPTEGEVLRLIAVRYLQATQPRCTNDFDSFLEYMEKMRLTITGVSVGCLLITVRCDSLQILERLWKDYSRGHLGEVVQRCFVTEEILTELSLAELKLETTISEEEYKACKMFLGKGSPTDQCGNVAVHVEQPIHVHFRDEDTDLQTETVGGKLETGTDEGSSVSEDEGISSYASSSRSTGSSLSTRTMSSFGSSSYASSGSNREVLLFRSRKDVRQIVQTGLEMFDVSSPKQLHDYLTYVTHKMCSEEEQPYTEEEITSQEGGTTGDQHNAAIALQEDVKRETSVVMEKTSKPVQESPCLKHLAEAMDDEIFRKFVTIHVKKGAWQVVMLFWDELIRRDSRNNDEDTLSGDLKSRNLTWWPTDGDRDLQVLCKILTEGDSKLDSLRISRGVTDEGVKHIAEALSNSYCHLNSLDLSGCNVTDGGVKHIAEALSNSYCHLNSLDLSGCDLTDDGVKHIAKALSNSHCHLNSLNLSRCEVTDDGVKHIADTLSYSHCHLNSLNLSWCEVTDDGVKHIAKALSSSHCHLNSLDLSWCNVTDGGVKHIAEALSNSHLHLNSLNLSMCKVTDEGVKHIAEALSNSHCHLNSVNLRGNYRITDKGVKHIAEALCNSHCHLNSLNLSWCNVTDEGVKHIAEALSNSHCHLNSLDVRRCKVTDEGVKHIAEALSNSHCHLNSLNLSRCEVTDDGVKHIAEALSNSHCHLRSLDLSECNVTDEGVAQLAEALKHSKYKLKNVYPFLIEVTAEVKGQVSEEDKTSSKCTVCTSK